MVRNRSAGIFVGTISLLSLLLVLIVALLCAPYTYGQGGQVVSGGATGGGAIPFAGTPTGTCTNTQVAVDTTTGKFYTCNNGAWLLIGPGAAGSAAFNTITSGTNTGQALTVGNGSTITTTGSGVNSANQINGAVPPTSAVVVGTNGSGQPIAATTTGSGTTVPLATSPVLTTPKVTTINDANGNPFIASTATASAVDSATITNAAAGNPATVTVSATGTDANINLNLVSKGSGTVQCNGSTCLPANGVTGSSLTAGQLITGNGSSTITVGNLTGDATTSGSTAVTVAKVNGTTVPTNAAADQFLGTTASATGAWASVPNCGDASHAVAYSTATHTWSCQAITTGVNPPINTISAATGSQAGILNANNPITWEWAQTSNNQTGLTFNESAASTGGTLTGSINNQTEHSIATASGSTATPLGVSQGSVTGTSSIPALQITSTWNNASLVGEGIVENVTDTSSAAGGLLLDLQKGGTSQFKVDKGGNATTNTITTSGSGGGAWTCVEGTPPVAAATKDVIYCDSTAHALLGNYNNDNGGVFEAMARVNGAITAGDVPSFQSATEIKDSGVVAANVTQNSVTGTTNQIPKFSAAHTITNSLASDNGTQWAFAEPVDMTSQPFTQDCLNDTTTGTTNALLAKLTSTGCIKIATTDTAVPVYIVGSGGATSGSSQVAFSGQAACKMDATASNTEGQFVIASTITAGDCHSQAAVPGGSFVVGTLLSNSTTSGSNSTVSVNPYFVNAGGGSGTVSSSTIGQVPVYTAATTVAGGPNLTWSSPALTVGVNATATGQMVLANGNASGQSVTIQNNGATSAYNFNLPTSAGTANGPLLSGGGGSTAETWGTRSGTTTVFATLNGGTTAGELAGWDANSNLQTGGFQIASIVRNTVGNATALNQVIVASATTSRSVQAIDFPQVMYSPAADCVNTVAGSGWSTGATPAALCRAGTNNKDALLSPWGASDVAYFKIHLPKDWDSASSTDLSIDLTSTDAVNGHTIIMQAATSCAKGDGSTTDDVAFNAAQSFSTITLNGNANRTWTATLTGLTLTGCAAQGTMWIKISRTTDTATNVGVYGATVDVPRLITVQAQ